MSRVINKRTIPREESEHASSQEKRMMYGAVDAQERYICPVVFPGTHVQRVRGRNLHTAGFLGTCHRAGRGGGHPLSVQVQVEGHMQNSPQVWLLRMQQPQSRERSLKSFEYLVKS